MKMAYQFIQQNMKEIKQVMQISFPAIPVRNSCPVIELFKNINKQEFYIMIEWSDQLYTLPLDPMRTFQSILDELIFQITEVAVFGAMGCYEFVFEMFDTFDKLSDEEIYNTTKQILQLPMTEIPLLSQGILLYNVNTQRTLDTHRWFVNKFAKAENKNKTIITTHQQHLPTESDSINHIQKLLMCYAIVCVLTGILAFCVQHTCLCNERDLLKLISLFVVLFSISAVPTNDLQQPEPEPEPTPPSEPIVHMCFSRSAIFYKNTHYVFSGTKKDLTFAFDKMQQEINEAKQEPYFNRGEYNELLDTPLDTFCSDKCYCHTDTVTGADKTNYRCSHWALQAFDTDEELEENLQAIKTKTHPDFNNGWRNEIEYI
jgi:hypothetical protein